MTPLEWWMRVGAYFAAWGLVSGTAIACMMRDEWVRLYGLEPKDSAKNVVPFRRRG
jgi:hypothetical protein